MRLLYTAFTELLLCDHDGAYDDYQTGAVVRWPGSTAGATAV